MFARGRAVHLFTVWKPFGWHTPDGLELGAPEADVTADLVASEERTCDGYTAIVAPGEASVSAFYVFRDELWGFGLLQARAQPVPVRPSAPGSARRSRQRVVASG